MANQLEQTGAGAISLDYLRFTVKQFTSVAEISAMFPELVFEDVGYGGLGYRSRSRCVGAPIDVYYEGAKGDMGVHVSISGQGMRFLELLPSFAGWAGIFRQLLELEANITRVDVALDDLAGSIGMSTVLEHVRERALSCAANIDRSFQYYEKADPRVPDKLRKTLYLGARTSERMMRVYEKYEVVGDAFTGLRFELEYKGKAAASLSGLLANDDWKGVAGCFRSFCDFKALEHSTTDVSRRRAANWWADLVGAAKFKLEIVRHIERSIERTAAHLKKQYAQFAFMITELSGGSIDALYELVEDGRHRLSKANRLRLDAAREWSSYAEKSTGRHRTYRGKLANEGTVSGLGIQLLPV